MDVLYDTRTVDPLDRYEYARAGAGAELAPVSIRGLTPGDLLAMMSVARIGELTIEAVTWRSDTDLVAHRTDRLIRACDPECYRVYLSVNGGVRMEQAGSRVSFGARDIALYDVSRPWRTAHGTGPTPMRLVMLTFPRETVPIARETVAPLVGTVMPRGLPGRDLIARFLIGLARNGGGFQDSSLAGVVRECTIGLIRQRLGQPDGITAQTRRLLHMAFVRGVIRRQLNDPALDPAGIARAASISPRYLHKLFQDSGFTPMQLVKRLRLEECHRALGDPALAAAPVREIIASHGYLRPDQFARDFKQLFGVSATQIRAQARRLG
jgi:AraC-like DNA-binding protein